MHHKYTKLVGQTKEWARITEGEGFSGMTAQKRLNNYIHQTQDPNMSKTEDRSELNSRTGIVFRAQLNPEIQCSPAFQGKISRRPARSL